ncbi:mechanosensitive ion channel family protein [uncultured Dokdonia sp.]|uniref:mechanosensitive ion channel family protein n=1 Tax=uncultured Dokdonia sp. TaxID=575653 RepID=UPI00262BBED3|nr:mechanosensitive ion channel family protein [uncultured Dokdonia sp.]
MTIETMEVSFEDAVDKIITKLESWFDLIVLNIPNIIIAIVVFTLVIIISRYTNKLMKKILTKTSLQLSMRRVIARFSSIVIIALGLFLVLGILNLGKTLNTILAGAGVLGLAVGLALQSALANTYSGIVLSYIKNIKNGDWIETNDFEGEVIDIDFRATTLRQKDNNLVYIPNKLVVENPVKNYSSTPQSRVILECGVAYGSDLKEVRSLTVQTIIDNFEVPKTEEDVLFLYRGFGDSSINYEIRFWIDSSSALEVAKAKSEAMIFIKEAYDHANIEIPFPIRTLDLGNQLDKFMPISKEKEDLQEA